MVDTERLESLIGETEADLASQRDRLCFLQGFMAALKHVASWVEAAVDIEEVKECNE